MHTNIREPIDMKTNLVKITGLCLLLGGVYSLPAGAAIKCWTNSEGFRECGDRVPPEYAQQGHQELNKSGLVVDQQERAMTREEVQRKAEEMTRLEEEKRKQQEQAKADNVLLATFTSVSEIELMRDERLQVIHASIALAEKQIDTIQQDLDKRIQAAAQAERSGNAPNDALLKDIDSLERQVKDKQDYIDQREAEMEQTRAEYDAHIDRFRELKGL